MDNLTQLLEAYTLEALESDESFVADTAAQDSIKAVCNNLRIKAPIRFLLSCCAAKIDNPKVDIRKPYTEIGDVNVFSGRSYDEKYIQHIIDTHYLPANATTAFLTPAFRNRNTTMLASTELVGRNPELYRMTLELLALVHQDAIKPEQLFKEIIRILFSIRDANANRIQQLEDALKANSAENYLSVEQIVTLLRQHLASKNASRLPVLMVTAAYHTISDRIEEQVKPLHAHNAADKQTGALGDIEIVLSTGQEIVTSYEMKDKRITKSDVEVAIQKIIQASKKIDNYIFITTAPIEKEVEDYAKTMYNETGIEIAVLDCIGFVKHFLHFFHRRRTTFLEKYQDLLLAEPNSSVNQPLKEVFLALRQAAEADR